MTWLPGSLIHRRRGAGGEIEPYALPFLGVGYLLSAIALAAGSGSRAIALPIYAAGVAIYALSAWLLKESLFLYPAAIASVVPYYLAMTLTPLPQEWYGLGLLPLVIALLALGRLAFDRNREPARTTQERLAALARPETPLDLVAYGVTIGMIAQSAAYPIPRTVVLAVVAAVYLVSAALFRSWLWLYPGLLAVHAALGSGLSLMESGGGIAEKARIALPYHALTWVLVACGLALSWKWLRARENKENTALTVITTPSWAQPFFLLAAVDVVVWQLFALYNLPVAIALAAGNTILLALLAVLWEDRALPYGAAVTLLLGVACVLVNGGTAWPWVAAGLSAAGLGLYLAGAGLAWAATRGWGGQRAAIWPPALTRVGTGAGTAALLAAIAGGVTGAPLAAAGALAATGALYLALAYRQRRYLLGYLALSMLLAAWLVTLMVEEVRQPQGYAIAAGLYLVTIGMLERRRGRQGFGCLLETIGVTVPMATSFVQSLTADAGLLYFVVLLLESVLVVWWSATRRVKVPFLVGVGFIVLNIGAQLAILATTNDVLRWVIIFGVGLLMVGSAILVERRRAVVASRLRDWQTGMHAWQI